MRTHHKWLALVAVVLMLASMIAYVASEDEAYTLPMPAAEQTQQSIDQ